MAAGHHAASGRPDGDNYYCDIELRPPGGTTASYTPFVRLSVARYQPDSLVGLEPNTAHASQVVLNHIILPCAIVLAIFIYPQFAIMTKRWHDRGKSGWWWLISFVPIIGGLWMMIELGFLPGEDGTNDYGYRLA